MMFLCSSPDPFPSPRRFRHRRHLPDIAARILRDSNCLLPLGFSATVNPRGAISLTVTAKATPAVTGLFLSNENTIGPAIDLLALVLREAPRDRR